MAVATISWSAGSLWNPVFISNTDSTAMSPSARPDSTSSLNDSLISVLSMARRNRTLVSSSRFHRQRSRSVTLIPDGSRGEHVPVIGRNGRLAVDVGDDSQLTLA